MLRSSFENERLRESPGSARERSKREILCEKTTTVLLILISNYHYYIPIIQYFHPNIRRELTTDVSEEDEEVELLDLRAVFFAVERMCADECENGLCKASFRFSFSRLRSSSTVTGLRTGASGNLSNRSVAKESFHSGFFLFDSLSTSSETSETIDLRPSFLCFISSVRSLYRFSKSMRVDVLLILFFFSSFFFF